MSEALLPMPRIETERLILRSWQRSDGPAIAEIFADEDNARYIGGTKPNWQAWRHFATIIGHFHLRGYTAFATEEKATGKTIGYVGPWYPEGWPEQEIGYTLVPEAHGKGYATEAAIASLKYVYEQMKWPTAISMIDKRNHGSKNVARKMGASFEKEAVLFGEFPAEVWRHLPPQEFMERHA